MSNHLTPLQVCERIIGPVEELARICGQGGKGGYLWRRGSGLRDAGDFPSTRHQRALAAHAAKIGLPLNPDWLIWGAPERDVDLVMAAHDAPNASAATADDLPGVGAQ